MSFPESVVARLIAEGFSGRKLLHAFAAELSAAGHTVRVGAPVAARHDGLLVAHAEADLLVDGDTAVLLSANPAPPTLRRARLDAWLASTELARVISIDPASEPVALIRSKHKNGKSENE